MLKVKSAPQYTQLNRMEPWVGGELSQGLLACRVEIFRLILSGSYRKEPGSQPGELLAMMSQEPMQITREPADVERGAQDDCSPALQRLHALHGLHRHHYAAVSQAGSKGLGDFSS